VTEPAPATVPQRLVIVSASTAEHDARGDRYARSVAARGHDVTVVARWRDGLARDASDPSGFRTIRFDVRAIDGIPFGRWLRQRLPVVSRIGRPSATIEAHQGAGAYATPGNPASTSVDTAASSGDGAASAGRGGRGSRLLRSFDWLVARLRFPLTIRAQTTAALRAAPPADVYLAMGIWAIPAALALGRRHGGKVIYDIGDMYLEARSLARLRGPVRSWLKRAERRWARDADALITANDSYADLLVRLLGAGRPDVIQNTPPRYVPPAEPPRRFHEVAGVPDGVPVVLYHGGLFPERGIEQLVEAIGLVPDAVLVVMGYGPLVAMLERRVREAEHDGRVVLLPPVPIVELPDWVASADVVAMLYQPTTLNNRYSTPNKLWEAIAVGVPVVASDHPGMGPVVLELDAGVLVDPRDPIAIAGGIRELLGRSAASRAALRQRLMEASRSRYSWEVQLETYLAILGRLTGKPW
jgi:glycosyltransferase involved in cell wall biosynthesis